MYNSDENGAAMAQETRVITADELFRMPDGDKYELVGGRLRKMTPPGSIHGVVEIRLGAALANHVDENHLGVVFAGDTGFKLASNPDTVRGPDVAFVARSRVPAGGIPVAYWPGAPDLAVEVLSPSETRSEIDEKIEEYLRGGTRQVWVVDPARRRVTIHRPNGAPQLLSEADTLEGADLLPGFRYPLS